jgi:hypothetical protein
VEAGNRLVGHPPHGAEQPELGDGAVARAPPVSIPIGAVDRLPAWPIAVGLLAPAAAKFHSRVARSAQEWAIAGLHRFFTGK